MNSYNAEQLRKLKVSELRTIASAEKVKYYQKLRKEELIQAILTPKQPKKPDTPWAPMPEHNGYKIFEHEHDFRKKHLTIKVEGGKDVDSVTEYLDDAKSKFVKIYEDVKGSRKTSTNLVVLFKIITSDDTVLYEQLHIRSRVFIKDDGTDNEKRFDYMKLSLNMASLFTKNRSSGYTFLRVEEAHLDFDYFNQMKGGSFGATLPPLIKKKESLNNSAKH